MANMTDVLSRLKKEPLPDVDYDNIPDELGGFQPIPQPGAFRFRIPQAWEWDIIEVKKTKKGADGKDEVVKDAEGKPVTEQRVAMLFEGPNSLIITQSQRDAYNGEPFRTRISNAERNRWAGKGAPMVKVSDGTYLIRALAPKEVKTKENADFVKTCARVLPGVEFGADIEWSGFCNPAKDAVFAFPGENGSVVYEPGRDEGASENKKGCGARIYQKDWPKENGVFAERATCPSCEASIRPFAQLVRFKP